MIKFVGAKEEGQNYTRFLVGDILECVYCGGNLTYVGGTFYKAKRGVVCLFNGYGKASGTLCDNITWRYKKVGELSLD